MISPIRFINTDTLINDYFNELKAVYSYFGFVEDWVILPLNNCTEYDWKLDCNEEYVTFGEKEAILAGDGDYYIDEIYYQRFYNKWVYRGERYTMIMVNTHTDGNRFLSVFDNSREIK